MITSSDIARTCSSYALEVPMDITIRDYVDSDLPGVLVVEEECFDEYSRYPRWIFEYYVRSGAVFRVAVHQNTVVGYAMASVEDGSCHIISIGVRRSFRRRGIGLKLMCEILLQCLARGISTAYLEVSTDNEPAIKLYKKLGFKVIGIIKNYYGAGRNAYIMWRELRG